MAETSTSETPSPSFQLTSYQTALCITPRRCSDEAVENVNRLRALYDQAYGKWPAHVNVLYPFVPVHALPEAVRRIREGLSTVEWELDDAKINLRLDVADYFALRQKNTVHLAPRSDGIQRLRDMVLEALRIDTTSKYNPHMTIGQTSHSPELLDSLLSKARMLVPFSWDVDQLEVWARDESGKMCFREAVTLDGRDGISAESEQDCPGQLERMRVSGESPAMEERTTYHFCPEDEIWKPAPMLANSDPYQDEIMPEEFTVSSYNVLVESAGHGPDRYPFLVRNILSDPARADVIIIQEVCDSFLAYLLSHDAVRRAYPFTSHGPPNQSGIGPLPSIRNIVVLSQRNIKWNWIPLGSRHKGAVIAEVEGVGKYDEDDNLIPLILAGVHLTAGLTDDGIESKRNQLQDLFGILSKTYLENPLVVAGDFNIATSAFSVEQALKNRKISHKAYDTYLGLEHLLADVHLSDAWYMARTEGSNIEGPFVGFHDIYEGEQGATFDPTTNPLALESTKTGSERPQRYDRILIQGRDLLSVSSFNMFGFPDELMESDDENDFSHFGSDHWGIRATFRLNDSGEEGQSSNTVLSEIPQFQRAPGNLASNDDLRSCIASCGMLPLAEDVKKRKEVFELVLNILTYGALPETPEYEAARQSAIPMKVVPVGSQGFGVWNYSSDVDVLCISSISSKTFFALAVQRLNRAADLGVRILRKVKAASGTMLEIDVHDIKLDIQYCPAAKIVERWSDLSKLPPNDPLFDLSIHSLTKLQPYRDMSYLLRTIPDLAIFRTAHRFIRAWAKHRGIYAAKFGFLGGIHITMMLSRLCKLYFRDAPVLTAADIVCTFFRHYAEFDWDNEIVYDPFFFKAKPRYRRYLNEPMVILTLHAPIINVARAVSVPSQRTIVEALKRADRLLSGDAMLWSSVIGCSEQGSVADLDEGAQEFLKDYSSYIKISVQYWGLSLAKGSALVGWLESRCLRLLVDLDRKLPEIHTRIWPARFTSRDTVTSSEDQEYQGCYLIGLARRDGGEAEEPKSKDERKQAHDSLLAALERFTSQLQGDEKYFDSSLAWIDATHVKKDEVKDLVLDKREWGNYAVLDDGGDDDSDEDESEDDMLIDPEVEEELVAKQKANKASKNRQVAAGKPGKKLRPATDILSRLRWDPAFDSGDYIIGYDDRFLGEMEMPLENWKGDQTHEDFIPMHRVLYFKRKADGCIVWDRRTRKDEIFGSGAGEN